jgi:hypothetical protein
MAVAKKLCCNGHEHCIAVEQAVLLLLLLLPAAVSSPRWH